MDNENQNLRAEVARGLRYTHYRANANTSKILEVTAFAYAAIEILAEKGLITIEELDQRKKLLEGQLIKKFQEDGIGAAYQDPEQEKYSFKGGVEIDCASRLHLCKAACCRLQFALSRQDVEEGILQWNFRHPYLIARKEDGYCLHLDGSCLGCTVHKHRPVPCRAYDCRQDKRIWSNFEEKIVSPDLAKLFTDPELQNQTAGSTMPALSGTMQ